MSFGIEYLILILVGVALLVWSMVMAVPIFKEHDRQINQEQFKECTAQGGTYYRATNPRSSLCALPRNTNGN